MGLTLPNKLTGTSREAAWHNRLRDVVGSIRLRSGLGYKLKETANGTFLEIEQLGGGGTPASISLYRFKSMGQDHIVCRSWDGTTEGATDVNIAKPPKLRYSVNGERIDGQVVYYSNYNLAAQTRLAEGGLSGSEIHTIGPRYLVNDLIYAQTAPTLVALPAGVTLLDLNDDGRAWEVKT